MRTYRNLVLILVALLKAASILILIFIAMIITELSIFKLTTLNINLCIY